MDNTPNAAGRCITPRMTFVALALLAVAAFVVRTLNHPQVFTATEIRSLDGDSMYHMHRVAYAVDHGLRLPGHDALMNYPQGLTCNWAPLFDWLLAGVALLAGAGHPSARLVATVGALAPPTIAALTVLSVFFVARAFLSRGLSLLAAAVFALMPFHVQLSVLGRPDHHVAVVLAGALTLLAACRLLEAPTPVQAVIRSVRTALLMAAMLAIWPGSALVVCILAAAFGLLLLMPAPPDRRLVWTSGGVACFIGASLVLSPIIAATPIGRTGAWRWDALSLFHPALMLTIAAAITALYLGGRIVTSRGSRGQRALALFAVMLVALVPLIVAGRSRLAELLQQGGLWMSKHDPILRHVEESAPMSWPALLENFSGLTVLFPLALAALLMREWRGRRAPAVLFTVWSVVAGAAAMVQQRFADMFCVCAAVLFAIVVGFAVDACARLAIRQRPLAGMAGALLLLSAVPALTPPTRWLRAYVQSAPLASNATDYALCRWLREATPVPSGATPGSPSAYSVLADWSLGNAITAIGQRANVANNFIGWPETRRANEAPYRFFVADQPADAAAILAEYNVRYVVVGEPFVSGQFARILDVLGLNHDDFFAPIEIPAGVTFQPTPRATQSMIYRLYAYGGVGLTGFERVFESDERQMIGGQMRPAYMVFRYTAP